MNPADYVINLVIWLGNLLIYHYRQISCEVILLIFMQDGPIFWRGKMGVVNGKTQGIKEHKESKKKSNHCLCYSIVPCKKCFLFCNYISELSTVKKSIFLAERSASFCLQSLLSELRELEICTQFRLLMNIDHESSPYVLHVVTNCGNIFVSRYFLVNITKTSYTQPKQP